VIHRVTRNAEDEIELFRLRKRRAEMSGADVGDDRRETILLRLESRGDLRPGECLGVGKVEPIRAVEDEGFRFAAGQLIGRRPNAPRMM
jgi:hypothetical protein